MTVEATRLEKLKVSNIRAQLGLTQRTLAKLAGVSPMVISNAENGYTILRLSAHAILKALNAQRIERNLEPLEFEQIEWKIRGEEK